MRLNSAAKNANAKRGKLCVRAVGRVFLSSSAQNAIWPPLKEREPSNADNEEQRKTEQGTQLVHFRILGLASFPDPEKARNRAEVALLSVSWSGTT